jgi:hypothetical protein
MNEKNVTKFRGIVIDQGKWIQWAVEEVGFNKMAEIIGVSRAVIERYFYQSQHYSPTIEVMDSIDGAMELLKDKYKKVGGKYESKEN